MAVHIKYGTKGLSHSALFSKDHKLIVLPFWLKRLKTRWTHQPCGVATSVRIGKTIYESPFPEILSFLWPGFAVFVHNIEEGEKESCKRRMSCKQVETFYFSVLNEVSQVRLSLLVVAMCIVICLHPTMCRPFLYSSEQRARRGSRNTESISHWSSNAGSGKRGCRATTRQRGHRYLFCGDLSKRAQFLSLLSLFLWASETDQRRNFIHFIQRNEI